MPGPNAKELLIEFSKLLKQDDTDVASKIADLINKGLQINSIYEGNTTALHLACESGNLHLVKAILHHYPAEAMSIILRGDANDGDTPIHMAAIGGNSQVLESLFEALALDLITVNDDDNVWRLEDKAPHYDLTMINFPNRWKQTPLHLAMGRGRVEAAKFLIDKGADIHGCDHVGSTPLHFAARSGSVACLEMFHFKWFEMSTIVNGRGLTALHFAAWNGRIDAADWLLKKGVDLRPFDYVKGRLALHLAAKNGSFEMVNMLFRAHHRAGVPILEEDYKKKTALQLMEKRGQHFILPLLRTLESLGLMERTLPGMVLVRYVVAYGDEGLYGTLFNCLTYVARKWRGAITSLFRDTSPQDDLTVLQWVAIKGTCLVSPVNLAKEYLSSEELESQLSSALQIALLHGNVKFAAMLLDHCDDRYGVWIKDMKHCFVETKEPLEKLEAILVELGNLDIGGGQEITHKGDIQKKLLPELPFAYLVLLLGRQDIAKFIKDHNAWDGIVNDKGHRRTRRTALHWATIFQQRKIVSQLCAIKECRANLMDSYGKPAYQYAMENGRQDIQKELSERVDVRSHLEILYRDRQVFVDASNAILVGAALIAGITFAGLLQPPLGYTFDPSSQGSVQYVRMEMTGVKVFWFFNSLSFFFAMATALAGARGVLPQPDIYIQEVVKSIRKTLQLASFLLVISITFALLAFGAAGFSVLPSGWKYQGHMLSSVVIGSVICIPTLVWFIKGAYSLEFKGNNSVKENEGKVMSSDRVEEPRRLEKTESIIKFEHREYPWKDGLDGI